MKRPKIFYIVQVPNACAYYRAEMPAKYLRRNGFDATVVDLMEWVPNASKYEAEVFRSDILVIQTISEFWIPTLIARCKEEGVKVIFDIDDNVFELTEDNPVYHLYQKGFVREALSRAMSESHLITATNDSMAKSVSKFNSNVLILPNSQDLEVWSEHRPSDNHQIRIGWWGGAEHQYDLDMVREPLKKIDKKFGDKISIIFFGYIPKCIMDELEHLEFYSHVPVRFFFRNLVSFDIDIAILPTLDTEFNRCKSDIKAQEAAMISAFILTSKVSTYSDFLEYATAVGDSQWYSSLETIVRTFLENKDIGRGANFGVKSSVEGAKNFVLEHKDIAKNINLWIDTYKGLIG